MNKLLILLVFIGAALGHNEGNATIGSFLRKDVFVDLKNALLPVVSKKIRCIKIPDMKGEARGYSYTLEDIYVDSQPLGCNNVSLDIPGDLFFEVHGEISPMKGSAKGKVKLGFISKNFEAKIDIEKLSFKMRFQLKVVDSGPKIEITGPDLDLKRKQVHVAFPEWLPPKFTDTLSLQLRKKVTDSVTAQFKDTVSSLLTTVLNQMLHSLSADVKITDKVYMRYKFIEAPSLRFGCVARRSEAYLHPFNDQTRPPGSAHNLAMNFYVSFGEVQIRLSDYVIKSAIYTLFNLNLIRIQVEETINDRDINMTCTASELPTFRFRSAATEANVTGVCYVALDENTSPDIQISASLRLDLVGKPRQGTLFFDIQKATFPQLTFKTLTPVDLEWLKEAFGKILDSIIEEVKEALGKKGIPILAPTHVSYEQLSIVNDYGYISVIATPVFNFTKVDEMETKESMGSGTMEN